MSMLIAGIVTLMISFFITPEWKQYFFIGVGVFDIGISAILFELEKHR